MKEPELKYFYIFNGKDHFHLFILYLFVTLFLLVFGKDFEMTLKQFVWNTFMSWGVLMVLTSPTQRRKDTIKKLKEENRRLRIQRNIAMRDQD